MVEPVELVAAIGALFGVLTALARQYDAIRREEIAWVQAEAEECREERDALRAEGQALLAAYRERDRADLERWRATLPGGEGS